MTNSVPVPAPPFPARIAATIERYGMFDPDDSVLVGVSGGADSVALLRVLVELGTGDRLAVGHFNHGWRGGESDADEAFVRSLAEDFGLECFVGAAGAPPELGPETPTAGLEQGARSDRREFLEACRREGKFRKVALAHNLHDRNETFLLNLMRGSGSDGLTAMRAVSGNRVRPLIEVTRGQIHEYLTGLGQRWRTDSTNNDVRFARNRVRLELFPRLERDFNPRLQDALARTIEILESDDRWMEQAVDQWFGPRARFEGPDLVVAVNDLAVEPVGFVRRVLRRALKSAGSPLVDIGFEHLEQVRTLLQPGKSGKTIELPGAISVERSFETLHFFRPGDAHPDYEYDLPIPGRVDVPEFHCRFEATLPSRDVENRGKPNKHNVFVDGDSIGHCVKIRNWKNGDSYNPQGSTASKLKTLFQKGRIPRRRRRLWPIVISAPSGGAGSSIVWVASFPVSADFAPTRDSRRVVELTMSSLAL